VIFKFKKNQFLKEELKGVLFKCYNRKMDRIWPVQRVLKITGTNLVFFKMKNRKK
jgi:hypothetical protein